LAAGSYQGATTGNLLDLVRVLGFGSLRVRILGFMFLLTRLVMAKINLDDLTLTNNEGLCFELEEESEVGNDPNLCLVYFYSSIFISST